MQRRAVAVTLVSTLACSGSPSGPSSPTPQPGHTVVAVVFYDEDGDGQASPWEVIRVPDVDLVVAGRSGRTEKTTGRAVITGVPAGQHAVTLRTETLPPFFLPGAPVTVSSPQEAGATAMVPVLLPIDGNRPNVYLAFGDSITGRAGDPTYPPKLQALLAAHFGGAEVTAQGRDGTNSFEGMDRIKRNVEAQRPAYTLVLYGTNDWNDPSCQDAPPCHTVENLRAIVQTIKREGSLTFLATLPPVNPALSPPGRNDWIKVINDGLRVMAREEGAVLVDVHAAFSKQRELPSLFVDHVHPSDAGQQLIAQAFFEAIAHGRVGAASAP
jgi:lysophospholipase L1-like esterase